MKLKNFEGQYGEVIKFTRMTGYEASRQLWRNIYNSPVKKAYRWQKRLFLKAWKRSGIGPLSVKIRLQISEEREWIFFPSRHRNSTEYYHYEEARYSVLAPIGEKCYDSEKRQSFGLLLQTSYLSEHPLQTDYVSNWPLSTITWGKVSLDADQSKREGKKRPWAVSAITC